MQPRTAVADAVHLACTRDPHITREVVVTQGTPFPAGKDEAGEAVTFQSDEVLVVTDAKVMDLRTLRFERDPLISPEREFDFVTRATSFVVPPPAPPGTAAAAQPAWPLFGGSDASLGCMPDDARIGLAIATPTLWLKVGEREVRVTLRFEPSDTADADVMLLLKRFAAQRQAAADILPVLFTRYLVLDPRLLDEDERGTPAALARQVANEVLDGVLARAADNPSPRAELWLAEVCYRAFLLRLLASSRTHAIFYTRLGRLFSRWLLADEEWLTEAELDAVKQTAQTVLGPDDAGTMVPQPGDPLSLIHGPHRPQRDLIFDQLFNGMFEIGLTAETGWYKAGDAFVLRPGAVNAPGAPKGYAASNGYPANGQSTNGHANNGQSTKNGTAATPASSTTQVPG